jgi:hypothetical protein
MAGINRSFISVEDPGTDLGPMLKAAEPLMTNLADSLIVDTYTRIGFRQFFERRYKTRGEASAYILSNMSAPRPSGKHFNIEGSVFEPEISFRWEGGKVGCRVLCKAEHVKIEVNYPYEFKELKPATDALEKHRVLIDIDYYTLADTPAKMVKVSDLIAGWARAVRRDLKGVLGG